MREDASPVLESSLKQEFDHAQPVRSHLDHSFGLTPPLRIAAPPRSKPWLERNSSRV
jgi:hypothetical protein